MKNIFLIDDHPLILESVKMLLQENTNYKIVGTATNPALAFDVISQYNPDILILDVSMPEIDAFTLVPELKNRFPDLKIIIYTMHALDRYYNFFIDQKVDGYVLKSGEYGSLINALDSVKIGERYLQKSDHYNNKLLEENQIQFNLKEKELIALLGCDLSNQEMAVLLKTNIAALMELRKNILIKANCSSTQELLKYLDK